MLAPDQQRVPWKTLLDVVLAGGMFVAIVRARLLVPWRRLVNRRHACPWPPPLAVLAAAPPARSCACWLGVRVCGEGRASGVTAPAPACGPSSSKPQTQDSAIFAFTIFATSPPSRTACVLHGSSSFCVSRGCCAATTSRRCSRGWVSGLRPGEARGCPLLRGEGRWSSMSQACAAVR